MDWKLFWYILSAGIALVLVQGVCAWNDGFLTQSQMRAGGVTNGWSFMEHGGMWADVFIVSPMVAYFSSKYALEYTSPWGIAVILISIVAWLVLAQMYAHGGITTPEAHTHDGRTTAAGWIHLLFAIAGMAVILMVYCGLTESKVARQDLLILAGLLTPFFYLGVAKFNPRWEFTIPVRWQVAISMVVTYVVTAIRIWQTS